jgi:hypothetical protein
MPRALRIALIVAGCAAVITVLGVAFFIWGLTSEHTLCFASFKTPDAASNAASSATDLGYEASVDERKRRTEVTFRSDESDEDAQQFRADFLRIVDAHGGMLTLVSPAISADAAQARGKTGCREFGAAR